MTKDRLYLLKPDFLDDGKGPYFCPGCAQMAGLLEFYPALKDKLDIHFVDFARPRPELVTLLGEANQGCPVLVLAKPPAQPSPRFTVKLANTHAFIDDPREIAEYLAQVHGTGIPH